MSLDSRLRLSGPPTTYPDLVRSSWRPGQSGFRMAVLALAVMPKGDGCCRLVKLAWHDPPLNRHSWSLILTSCWLHNARAVVAAAGSRQRLVRYFEAMEWDLPMVPFLRRCSCHRLDLPPVLTLFRGGLAPAGELMRGLAWTPYPSAAARYAMACLLEREEKGEPIILRCRVPRERVLWRHALGERETLVDVADATIACADRPRIERLARRSLRLHAKGLRQWNAMNADLIREPERWNKVPE